MTVVAFDWALWSARYAELSPSVTEQLAAIYFEEAGLYCDNTDCSPVQDLRQRLLFLNMLTAHLVKLNVKIAGQAPSPLVGRISQATEGSVSVTTTNDYPPGTVQWYQSTTYGAAFWAATAQYRTAHYITGPEYIPDPYAPLPR